MEILDIVVRTITVYLFIILAIRIFGKKELSQLSVVDLVFILLISNSVQNAMVGSNNTLLSGLVAAGCLFVVNFILKQIFSHSKKIDEFVEGNPIMLIYDGKVLTEHLKKSGITMSELEAAVREHGVKIISDVNLAVLEVDGNISILSDNFHAISTKKRKAHKYLARSS